MVSGSERWVALDLTWIKLGRHEEIYARYFVHTRSRNGLTVTDEGQVLSDVDAACIEALLAAEEIWEVSAPSLSYQRI
jgi:hypothetical protein